VRVDVHACGFPHRIFLSIMRPTHKLPPRTDLGRTGGLVLVVDGADGLFVLEDSVDDVPHFNLDLVVRILLRPVNRRGLDLGGRRVFRKEGLTLQAAEERRLARLARAAQHDFHCRGGGEGGGEALQGGAPNCGV
jgi:hypothetical protein